MVLFLARDLENSPTGYCPSAHILFTRLPKINWWPTRKTKLCRMILFRLIIVRLNCVLMSQIFSVNHGLADRPTGCVPNSTNNKVKNLAFAGLRTRTDPEYFSVSVDLIACGWKGCLPLVLYGSCHNLLTFAACKTPPLSAHLRLQTILSEAGFRISI